MGIWVIALSIGVVVSGLDFGVANSTRNLLVGSQEEGQKIFHSGFWAAAVLAICYWLMVPIVGIVIYYSYTDFLNTYIYISIAWAFFSLRIPFQIAINSFYSYHEATNVNAIEFFVAFTGLIAAVTLTLFGSTLIVFLIVINLLGFGWSVAATLWFLKRRGWCFALPKLPFKPIAIFRAAWPFSFLQLSSLLISGIAPFIVGIYAGIDEVTGVKASMMAAQAFLSIQLVQVMPLWVEFTKLHQESTDRNARIDRLLVKLRREVFVMAFIFLAFTLVAPLIINIWLGENVTGYILTSAFMIWGFFCGVGNIYSMVLNGMNAPKLNGYASLCGGVVAIISSLILGKHFGSIGVGISFALGSIVSGAFVYLMAKDILSKLQNQSDQNI